MKAALAIALASFLVAAALGFQEADPEQVDKPVKPEAQQPPQPAPKPTPAKTVECQWRIGQIEFDGVIKEFAWTNAQVIELSVPWQKRKSKTATKARLLWDQEYLYFSAEMEDHDLYADVEEDNGPVSGNDAFGLFIKPSATNLGYYQFMVNAASTPLHVFFPSRGGGGSNRFAAKTACPFDGSVDLQGTLNDWTDKDKGWSVEARIPWSAFKPTGGRPQAGDRWRFAFCRCDYSVTLEQPELSTSARLTGPDFHRYEEYQEMVFVERK